MTRGHSTCFGSQGGGVDRHRGSAFGPFRQLGLQSFAFLCGQFLVSMRGNLVESQSFLGLIDGILEHSDLGARLGQAGVELGIRRIKECGECVFP